MEVKDGKFEMTIPLHNKVWVDSELEKIAKRAVKLGLPAPAATYGAPYVVKRKSVWTEQVYEKKMVHVTIENTMVKIPGFKFLAKIEYGEGGNLLYPVPGATIDERYRTSECYCDHCHLKRDRKLLYIFDKEADGTQIQVGKNCLHDYMGIDAAAMAFYAGLDKELASAGEDDEYDGGGYRASYHIDLAEFTTIVAAVIEYEGGYVSGATASAHEVQSTSALAQIALWPNWKSGEQVKYHKAVMAHVTPELAEKAVEAIRWIREEWKDSSDYAWNLKVIAKAGAMLSGKQFGMGASLWPTYVRQMGWLKQKEMAAKAALEAVKDSEFLGTEGARLKGIKATVTMAHFIKSGEWGDTYLYKFLTPDGNVLSWFSSPRGLTKGDEVTIDGTVKEHKEYKGVKETQLTRCKVKGKEGLV